MTIFAAEKTNVSQNNYALQKLIGSHDFGKCPYFFMKSFDMPFHIFPNNVENKHKVIGFSLFKEKYMHTYAS